MMRLLTFLLALSLLASLPRVWAAAGSDKASAVSIEVPTRDVVKGYFCSPTQVDWYRILPPPRSVVFATVQPGPCVDVAVDLQGYTSTNPYTTIDTGRFAGVPETPYLDNFSSSDPPSVNNSTYLIIHPTAARSIAFPCPYEITFETYDLNTPLVRINAKRTVRVGQMFNLDVSFFNTGETDRAYDLFLGLEYQGVWYWWPQWIPDGPLTPSAIPMLAGATTFLPGDAIAFPVTADMAGVGPLNFYAAMKDPNKEFWSNLAVATISFVP